MPVEPLRIGIVASARHPISEPFAGGLERHTHLLAGRLRDRGHHVRVFASATSDPALGVEPVCDTATGLDLSRAARGDASMLSEPFMREHHAYLHLMLRLAGERWDVVQNSSLHYLPPAMAATLPCPMVTTLHTPPTPWLESALSARPAVDSAYFVAVSQCTAAQWRPRVRVDEVILNGVEADDWPYRASGDAGTAAWVGRIVPEKGPHLAIRAAHAAGLRITLAGPVGDDRYAAEEVMPLLEDGDRYLGHLAHDALAMMIGHAGVLLCTPCWEEPYGLVAAEALACGTPVAAFDRGAMREVIDEESGRLAAPGDADDLARAAREALSLDRAACRRRATDHCSAETMIDRYELLYSGLVSA